MTDQAENLRKRVGGLQRKKSVSANKEKKSTKIITISSGKGGVGKSNLSVNLAIAYARLGKKTLLLDADLGMANVNIIMGINPPYTLYHFLNDRKSIKDIIYYTPYHFYMIGGASGFFEIANLSDSEKKRLRSELNEILEFDIVIIDTGAGVSDNVLMFLSMADHMIVVTTPEPTAITDAYGTIKVLSYQLSDQNTPLSLVVNRVENANEGQKIANRICDIAHQFLQYKVDYLGYVLEDIALQTAVLKQKPVLAYNPGSSSSMCIENLMRSLEQKQLIKIKNSTLFNRFFKKSK